jgi:leucyl aminopeptidase
MHIKFTPFKSSTKAIMALPVGPGKVLTSAVKKLLGAATTRQLEQILKAAPAFEGEKDQFLWTHPKIGAAVGSVLLYGTGKKDQFETVLDSQKTGGQIFQQFNGYGVTDGLIVPSDFMDIQHCALGVTLRAYHFDNYRTKDKAKQLPKVKNVSLITDHPRQALQDWQKLVGLSEGVYLARDLMNQPPNICTPEGFVKTARAAMKDLPVKFTVLDKKAISALKMGALEAVSRGNRNDPYILIAEYNGSGKGKTKSKPVALVGKGVTFDTGGYNLKPGSGALGTMGDMKYDMGGAAAVIGSFMAVAKSGAKTHMVAIVGLTENLIDEDAYLPGEVVTTLSGQTVEIIDTDAEGRLVLADLLTYVQDVYDPAAIIDIATLTGAIVVALGLNYSGLFSNNDALADGLQKSGILIGEKCWRMPLDAIPVSGLRSPIADLANLDPSRLGGACFAAVFLEQFIDKGRDWAHLDIASMMKSKGDALCPAGAMGYGVRLLYQYVMDYHVKGDPAHG